jgi:hypothetical protein
MTVKRVLEVIAEMQTNEINIYEFAIMLVEEQKEQAAKIAEAPGQPTIAATIRST